MILSASSEEKITLIKAYPDSRYKNGLTINDFS
jgi:hypothetical protein